MFQLNSRNNITILILKTSTMFFLFLDSLFIVGGEGQTRYIYRIAKSKPQLKNRDNFVRYFLRKYVDFNLAAPNPIPLY